MFRKVLAASIIGFMLTSTLVATSASAAAISNGTACPKSKINKTTKVNGSVYKCTKNPTVKKAKLTWVSRDCLKANTSYAKMNTSYLALVKELPATLAALDVKITAELVKVEEAKAKAVALDLQIKTWTDKLTQFTAAREALIADTANATKNRSSISTYTSAITSLKSAIRSATASSVLYGKVGKTVEAMKTTRENTVVQLGQAKEGVAQALSLRGLVCDKGL